MSSTKLKRVFTFLYKIWRKVGAILGMINTRIILALIYFFAVTPIALTKKIFRADAMSRKKSNQSSYKLPKQAREINHMERPF